MFYICWVAIYISSGFSIKVEKEGFAAIFGIVVAGDVVVVLKLVPPKPNKIKYSIKII